MKIRLFLFLLVFACLLFASSSYGQNKLITVDAKDIPLNQLLKQVAAQYQIRFAFDDDLLSKQKVSLKINSLPIDSFLKIIEEQYGFGHRFVGGSYVIVKSARQPVEKPEVKKKPPPVQQPIKPLAAPESQEIHFQWVGLHGYVSDAISGEKIRYCQVIINNNKELITNELGFFHSKATLKKEVRIVIAHLGYKRLDTLLQVQALTNTISVDLQLEPMSVVLGPIDIVGREKFLI
jgi:type II secretory pathway component GspD/PulD (secretin)